MDERRFLTVSLRLGGLVDTVAVAGLCGSWLGLFGSWHWLLDLCSHFRWQYLVLSAVLLVWWLRRRRRWLAAAACATLLANAWLLWSIGDAGPVGRLAADFQLRVVSLNVLTQNRDHGLVLDYLLQAEADVIFLMEVDAAWCRALQPLCASHPHHLLHPRPDNFGVALFSRVPLQELRLLAEADFGGGDPGLPAVVARLQRAGRNLVLVGMHPLPPVGNVAAARRDAQLRATAQWLGRQPAAAVLVGDLNATPWSHGMRLLTANSELRLSATAGRPTWRARSPFALPIDHALVAGRLRVLDRQIGPAVGSDHRPQRVDLGWVE